MKGKGKAILSRMATALIIAVALLETGVNAHKTMSVNLFTEQEGYFDDYAGVRSLLDARDELSGDFYRTETSIQSELDMHRRFNNPSLYGYNGLSIYSPTNIEGVTRFYLTIGLPIVGTYAYSFTTYGYALGTPLSAGFLNLRYLISDIDSVPRADGAFWEAKAETGGLAL